MGNKFTDVNSSQLMHEHQNQNTHTSQRQYSWTQTFTWKIMFIPVHCNKLHTFGQFSFIYTTHTQFEFGAFAVALNSRVIWLCLPLFYFVADDIKCENDSIN